MKGPTRVLVIDADVARAAGCEPLDRPWPEVARDSHQALEEIRSVASYRVAFDRTLKLEWKKHAGKSATRWFAVMLGARRVEMVDQADDDWIKALIRHLPERDRPTASKDRHIVALACGCDQRLISSDRKAREKFARLTKHDSKLASLHWVCVCPETRRWLRDGSPDRGDFRLA